MRMAFTRSSTIFDESRATKELLAFLENGYEIIVFGWDRRGNAEESCNKMFRSFSNQIQFCFYKGETGSNAINKIISRGWWNRWLRKELGTHGKFDVIHACDYDTGAAVRRFAKRNNTKYVYDIYDYYVDAHPVPKFLRNTVERDEIKTINDAELTIICTEERREQIKLSNPKKIEVIHNSPDVERTIFEEEVYDYAYCGALFGGRLIKEILDLYSSNSEFHFVLAGSGTFTEYAKKLDIEWENFTYKGAIPYLEVLEIESKSKVISAIYEPTIRNHQLCAPNKFYEALALGKPLIVCRGTGIDKVVEQHNLGIVINYSAEEFYTALQRLCNDSKLRRDMGERARILYEQNYRWSLMKKKLIGTYKTLKI